MKVEKVIEITEEFPRSDDYSLKYDPKNGSPLLKEYLTNKYKGSFYMRTFIEEVSDIIAYGLPKYSQLQTDAIMSVDLRLRIKGIENFQTEILLVTISKKLDNWIYFEKGSLYKSFTKPTPLIKSFEVGQHIILSLGNNIPHGGRGNSIKFNGNVWSPPKEYTFWKITTKSKPDLIDYLNTQAENLQNLMKNIPADKVDKFHELTTINNTSKPENQLITIPEFIADYKKWVSVRFVPSISGYKTGKILEVSKNGGQDSLHEYGGMISCLFNALEFYTIIADIPQSVWSGQDNFWALLKRLYSVQ